MPHQVLRFARSDRDGFVLVQVRPDGTRSLDVKLVGTEGDFPYTVSLRQAQVSSPRVKSGPCTDAEWQSILESVIRQDPLHDVEATATVQSEACLSITVRKRVGEVTQRLGAVTLKYSPEEAIELFEWCGDSVAAAAKLGEDLAAAERSQSELEQAVRVLKSQLDEFVVAKERDETLWLEKFRDLVNEKKAKIREQQERLATVKSGPGVPGAAAVPGAQPARAQSPPPEPSAAPAQTAKKTGRKPGPSRPGKRKTRAALLKEEEAAEAEAEAAAPAADRRGAASAAAVPYPAADRMDVDHDTDGEPMSSHQVTTDDDDVTASETDGADNDGDDDDDDGIEAAAPAKPAATPVPASTSPEPSSRRRPARRAPVRRAPARNASQKEVSQQAAAEKAEAQVEAPDAPPPRRELPFGTSKTRTGPGPTEAASRKAQPKETGPRGADSESEPGTDEEL